jgi:DNA-binding MurR/RpiR family transcriptional regulator
MFNFPTKQLTPHQLKIADYFNRYTQQALLQTEEEIAEALQISNATVSRFFKMLGYRNYKAFKQAHRQKLSPLPQNKLTHVKETSSASAIRFQKLLGYLHITEQHLSIHNVHRFTEILKQAHTVHIFSFGVSKGLGELLFYRLRRIGIAVALHTEGGSELMETLLHITRSDTVLFFSFHRLISEHHALLHVVKKKQIKTIAFTDQETLTTQHPFLLIFLTDRGKPNEYHSMIGPTYLIERLVEALIKDTQAETQAEALVELRSELKSFLPR